MVMILKRLCLIFAVAAIASPSFSQEVKGKIGDDVDFKLKFGGRVNIDLGTYLGADDGKANRNGISANDCRLGVTADIDTVWQAKLEVSFSAKAISFKDVYIKRTFLKGSREVQFGNFFFPFGFKRAGLGYKFVDTAPTDATFTPWRKLGIAYQSFTPHFNWGAGVFSAGDVDNGKKTNQGYSFNAYALLRPIDSGANILHFTVSGIFTHPSSSMTFTTPMPLMYMSSTAIKTSALDIYNYGMLEVGALGIVRRFYAEARFIKMWANTPNQVANGTSDDGQVIWMPQDNFNGSYGVYVQASWRIFGENQNYNRKTGLGGNPNKKAMEVLARFDHTDLDYFGSVNNTTVGVNYFFNKYIRVRLNYVHAHIRGGADLDALCSRVQFSF